MTVPSASLRGSSRVLAVLTAPGAPPLLLARVVGSLPVGMVPLGIILALRAGGSSYALAGLADGAYALGLAVTQPLFGRLVDRAGMRRVLGPLAVVFAAFVAAFALATSQRAPAALDVVLALLGGASMPPLGACMRVLWPLLIPSEDLRAAAFAIDATLQELAFIVGPPLLALVVSLAGPEAALLAAAGAGLVGTAAFAALARARHAPGPHAGGALRSAGVRRVLALSVLLGGAFGATEVAMPAFCELHGARPAAGVVLAALALGSACGGVIFGGRASRMAPARRLLVALVAFSLLLLAPLAAPSIAVMAVVIFAAGMPIAPIFGGTYLLLDRFSMRGALTETFAWNTTCVFVGGSLGTAVGGALIAPGGYRASLALAVALALASLLLVWRYARGGRFEQQIASRP